jgi:hypothetical protein
MKSLVISDFIGAIAPYLPTICQNKINKLKKLTSIFPNLLSTTLIFEYCLNQENSLVDLSLGINSATSSRNLLLAGLHPYIDLPQNLLDNDAWQQVRSFARAWIDKESTIHNFVDTVWLEFDSELALLSNCPIPSFFFASDCITSEAIEETIWVTNDALKLIFGRSLKSDVCQQVYKCIRLLPKETYARSFGIMLSRSEERVRMVTSQMPADRVLDYLTTVGWSGNQKDIQPIIMPMGQIVQNINVSIDLGSSIGSRLGLEFKPDDGLTFNQILFQWKQIFEILSTHQLCLANVSQEILSFPGAINDRVLFEASETWQYATALMGSKAYSLTFKDISHLKLVVESGKPLQAKIYLRVGQAWLDKRQITNCL